MLQKGFWPELPLSYIVMKALSWWRPEDRGTMVAKRPQAQVITWPHLHEDEQTQTKMEKSLLCKPLRDKWMRFHPNSWGTVFVFLIWPKWWIHEKKRLVKLSVSVSCTGWFNVKILTRKKKNRRWETNAAKILDGGEWSLKPSWERWPQRGRWGYAGRCRSARCPQTRWAGLWCKSWRWRRRPVRANATTVSFPTLHYSKEANMTKGALPCHRWCQTWSGRFRRSDEACQTWSGRLKPGWTSPVETRRQSWIRVEWNAFQLDWPASVETQANGAMLPSAGHYSHLDFYTASDWNVSTLQHFVGLFSLLPPKIN